MHVSFDGLTIGDLLEFLSWFKLSYITTKTTTTKSLSQIFGVGCMDPFLPFSFISGISSFLNNMKH